MNFHFQLYKLSFILLITTIPFLSCRKNSDADKGTIRNETGYLLSGIVSNNDSINFEFNKKNQLVKMSGRYNTSDSFVYNSEGKLLGCRSKLTMALSGSYFIRIGCSYKNDTIVKTIARPGFTDAKRYFLSNNRVVKAEFGGVFNGAIDFYSFSTRSFSYNDSNLIYCFHPFVSTTYQPIDTFTYHHQLYNPYMTLGPHLWTLLLDNATLSFNLMQGETRNLSAIETYASHRNSGSGLDFIGSYSFHTFVLDTFTENNFLPKTIKKVYDNGIEETIKFSYVKAN